MLMRRTLIGAPRCVRLLVCLKRWTSSGFTPSNFGPLFIKSPPLPNIVRLVATGNASPSSSSSLDTKELLEGASMALEVMSTSMATRSLNAELMTESGFECVSELLDKWPEEELEMLRVAKEDIFLSFLPLMPYVSKDSQKWQEAFFVAMSVDQLGVCKAHLRETSTRVGQIIKEVQEDPGLSEEERKRKVAEELNKSNQFGIMDKRLSVANVRLRRQLRDDGSETSWKVHSISIRQGEKLYWPLFHLRWRARARLLASREDMWPIRYDYATDIMLLVFFLATVIGASVQ